MDDSNDKRDTVAISFRLEKADLDQLRLIARTSRISLNTLVSQLVHNYLRLWVFDLKFGFHSISNGLIQMAFANLTEEEIKEIAEHEGAKVHREIIRHLYGKVSKKTVVDYLDIFGSRFESFRHFDDQNSTHTLAITHNVNLAFSKVYYNIIRAILDLAKIDTVEGEADISERGFSISFDV